MEPDIFVKILLSVLFGAILGLETETRDNENIGQSKANQTEKNRIGGFRTYTLISLMGGISGILFINKLEFLSFTLLLSLAGFLFIAYFMNIKIKDAFGITTEIAVILTFIIGFLTTTSIIKLEIILVILVIVAFFLSQKRGFGKFISKIDHREVIDVFRFGLIALVILPIFPNRAFTVLDFANLFGVSEVGNEALKNFTLGNPFQIWMIVVIISGVNLSGYILSKLTGEKIGLFFTSIFSGFISSTSGTISFATKSKLKDENLLLAGAAIISNATSFVFVGALLLISNREFFALAFPVLLGVFIVGFVLGSFLLFTFRSDTTHKIAPYEPFSVIPALKFVSIVVTLNIIVQVLELANASTGFVIFVTALSGVTGIDPTTVAIAGLVSNNVISVETGLSAFLLAVFFNIVAKIAYSYLIGTRNFTKYLTFGLMTSALVGLIIYFL